MKHLASKFLPTLRKRVGEGYVYGTVGQTCTIALLKSKQNQYGARMGNGYYQMNGDYSRGKCARWLGMRVQDCSNMLISVRRELKETIKSHSAHMLWDTCKANRGVISKMPNVPGMLVFRNGGTAAKPAMGHVAMLDIDGYVIESVGVTKGVIRAKPSKAWTHYGQPDWLTMDVQLGGAVPEPTPEEPTGAEETKPIFFVTTKDCCYLSHVANRFGIKDWRIITLDDGVTKPNPLNMKAGIRLIVGYEIAPVQAEPVYFTTTKDLYKLIPIAKYFTEKLGVKINWTDIRTKDGKIPNPLAIQIGMILRIR